MTAATAVLTERLSIKCFIIVSPLLLFFFSNNIIAQNPSIVKWFGKYFEVSPTYFRATSLKDQTHRSRTSPIPFCFRFWLSHTDPYFLLFLGGFQTIFCFPHLLQVENKVRKGSLFVFYQTLSDNRRLFEKDKNQIPTNQDRQIRVSLFATHIWCFWKTVWCYEATTLDYDCKCQKKRYSFPYFPSCVLEQSNDFTVFININILSSWAFWKPGHCHNISR